MKQITDHIGIILSCICLIHCLLLPFVLNLLLLVIHNDGFHLVMLIATVLISGHAIWHGYKRHCKHIVLGFGIIGIICMTIALFVHEVEIILTLIGCCLILGAHLFNLKTVKCCRQIHK